MTEELARAWDEAAEDYERYFVPRFAPWVAEAVRALTGGALPAGPILVPCCGTFPELPALVEAYPGREIVGIDLSAGMVALARARAGSLPGVTVIEGDAAVLDRRWLGECAGVVSVFGLQQLPEPPAALARWAAALRPGGRMSVMFWSADTEQEGPFALFGRVLARHRPPADVSWEGRLVPAVTANGAVVVRDEEVPFAMSHDDASTIWAAMVCSGPWRALANARGEEFMRSVAREFLALAPEGEWHHRPRARLIVADRPT